MLERVTPGNMRNKFYTTHKRTHSPSSHTAQTWLCIFLSLSLLSPRSSARPDRTAADLCVWSEHVSPQKREPSLTSWQMCGPGEPSRTPPGFGVLFLGGSPKTSANRWVNAAVLGPHSPLKDIKGKDCGKSCVFLSCGRWLTAEKRPPAPGSPDPCGCSDPLLQPQWCCVQRPFDSRFSPQPQLRDPNTSLISGLKPGS